MAGGCSSGDAVYIGAFAPIANLFEGGIDGVLSKIATAIMGAAIDLFSGLGNVPSLAGTTNGSGQTDRQIDDQIHGQVSWLAVTIAVASLLAAAFRMALERRGVPGTEALKGLVRMVLVAGASWYVIRAVATEADRFSDHLYEQGIKAQLQLIAQCGTDGLTAFLLIIIGLLLLIAGCAHVIIMYIRLGVLTLLIGTLPVAAAASMTETGTGWWRKHLAWIVAWLLYKPTVGLIMFGGAAMIGATGGDAKQYKLAGAAILLMAGVALPALMRLVVPAMESFGSGSNTGGLLGAAGGAAGAAASGARKLSGGSSGGGGSRAGASGSSVAAGGAAAGRGAAASGGGGGGGGAGGGKRAAVGRAIRATGGAAASGIQVAASAAHQGTRVAASLHKHAAGITHGPADDK